MGLRSLLFILEKHGMIKMLDAFLNFDLEILINESK